MKRIILSLGTILILSASSWAGVSSVGTMLLDQTIPCPTSGEIQLSGIYAVVNGNISASLIFKNCTYTNKDDTVTINGSADISGVLPVSAGDLDLTITFTNVQFNEKSSDETLNETCTGNFNFKGNLNSNGMANLTRNSTFKCDGSGNTQISIQELVDDILKLDF